MKILDNFYTVSKKYMKIKTFRNQYLIKNIIFGTIIIVFSSLTFSQYYADITINVENNGRVNIEGKTNYEEFAIAKNTQKYTSKKEEYWILNISTKDKFDNFIFELNLPKHSEINYIKTTPTFRIDEKENKIIIIGTGENKPLTLIVQYKTNFITEIKENNYLSYLLITILLAIMLFFGVRMFKFKNNHNDKSNNINNIETSEEGDETKDLTILPERQQDIISILRKKGKITQKELEKEMQIPKSSVSRNVQTLVIKGIVKKEQVGVTNYLSLKL